MCIEKANPDTIDALSGNWRKISFGNNSGYVFDGYLSFATLRENKKFPSGNPQMIHERYLCGTKAFFNKDLKWYGLYELEKGKYELRKVEIEFDHSEEILLDIDPNIPREQLQNSNIKTSESQKSEILFGLTFEPSYFTFQDYNYPKRWHGDRRGLFPGESIALNKNPITNAEYYLECLGTADSTSFSERAKGYVSDYELRLTEYTKDNVNSYTIWKGKGHPERFPIIDFIGDLNGDYIPDIIWKRMEEWTRTTWRFHLSGVDDDLITLVAETYFKSCY